MKKNRFVDKFLRLTRKPPLLIAQTLLGKIPGHPIQIAKFFVVAHFGSPVQPRRGFGLIRQGLLNDIAEMCKVENKEALFKKRFAEGEHCIVAIDGDQIIGYSWFSIQSFHIEDQFNYRIEIDDNCIYAYDAVIKPGYRAMRALWSFFQFHQYMHEFGKPLGRNTILTIIDYGNNPSIRIQLKLGVEFQQEVFAIKFFGKSIFRKKGINHKDYDINRAFV